MRQRPCQVFRLLAAVSTAQHIDQQDLATSVALRSVARQQNTSASSTITTGACDRLNTAQNTGSVQAVKPVFVPLAGHTRRSQPVLMHAASRAHCSTAHQPPNSDPLLTGLGSDVAILHIAPAKIHPKTTRQVDALWLSHLPTTFCLVALKDSSATLCSPAEAVDDAALHVAPRVNKLQQPLSQFVRCLA